MDTATIPFSSLINEFLLADKRLSLYSILDAAYREACLDGKEYLADGGMVTRLPAPLEKERLPDAQGLYVQSKLHSWAQKHPELIASFDSNKKKREHVAIRSNGVLMTAHRVKSPDTLPPPAHYRLSNACLNFMWLPGVTLLRETDNQSYVFLLHGPSCSDMTQLGFIQIVMPTPEGNGIIAKRNIFLHSDYSISNTIEEIEDTAVVTLKPQKIRKSS